MSNLKPIIRRPKAAEDVEGHAMYIAVGNIDAAFRFLERAEQTHRGANKIGEGLSESCRVLHRARPCNRDNSSSTRWSRHEHRSTENLATAMEDIADPAPNGARKRGLLSQVHYRARSGLAIPPAIGLKANSFLVDKTQHRGFDR